MPVELRFLYLGSDNTDDDLAAWLALPGARLRWRFDAFGADVAAVDLGAPPLVLLADHRPAGSVLPIYAVTDLDGGAPRPCWPAAGATNSVPWGHPKVRPPSSPVRPGPAWPFSGSTGPGPWTRPTPTRPTATPGGAP